MDILILIFGFVVGLIFLVKGADEMVDSAIQIALKFKIPSSIIGATFIGFGTSAPELFASTGAALNGDLDLGIGNIVGSNIANSLLVVAVLYLAIPKDFDKKIKLNQLSPVWMAILTTVFVSTYVLFSSFPLYLGIVLLVLTIYVVYKMVSTDSVEEEDFKPEEKNYVWLRGLLSLAATLYGSQLVVDNAVKLAERFGVWLFDIIGATMAWTYLRFFQQIKGREGYGDNSPLFAFHMLFPPGIRYVVLKFISTPLYYVFCNARAREEAALARDSSTYNSSTKSSHVLSKILNFKRNAPSLDPDTSP